MSRKTHEDGRTVFFCYDRVYSAPSVCPVGTGAQAGPPPFESHKDVSAKVERKAPVEETTRKIPPDISEHVVGRIEEKKAFEVADLKINIATR